MCVCIPFVMLWTAHKHIDIYFNFFFLPDVNECAEGTNNCNQECMNTPGSYECSCRPGYTLDTNMRDCIGKGRHSHRWDYCDFRILLQMWTSVRLLTTCAGRSASIPLGLSHAAVTVVMSWTSLMAGLATVSDIATQPIRMSVTSLKCFHLAEIHECNQASHLCEQVCTNTNGSYQCSCNSGYSLSINRFSCSSKLMTMWN